jgi:anti-sigma factor RsiW
MSSKIEKHDHSKCIELFEKLSEYIDDELDEMTCKDIERHVKECAPCNACLETLKRTMELCKNLENKPVPEAVSSRLKSLIQGLC